MENVLWALELQNQKCKIVMLLANSLDVLGRRELRMKASYSETMVFLTSWLHNSAFALIFHQLYLSSLRVNIIQSIK